MLTPAQVRMARAGLGISARVLAERSGVAESSIQRFEAGRGGMQASTRDKIQHVLEQGGVIFIHSDGDVGPGVRLKSPVF